MKSIPTFSRSLQPSLVAALLITFGNAQVKAQESTANKALVHPSDYTEEEARTRQTRTSLRDIEIQHRKAYDAWPETQKQRDPWTTWHREKMIPALLKLSKIRENLFKNNLFDSYPSGKRPKANRSCSDFDRLYRSYDGTCNDWSDPAAGAAGTRFGRNIDTKVTQKPSDQDLLYPNPRTVSAELFHRDNFKPVSFLNLFATSWIQFMTHDWFSHGENDTQHVYNIPLQGNDYLINKFPFGYMLFPSSRPDVKTKADQKAGLGPTYSNEVTHWWDGSQIYGSSKEKADSLRSFKDGKLIVREKGMLPSDFMGFEETGFRRNWWVGLSVLHTLFVNEHNQIAAMLKSKVSKFNDGANDDEEIYQTARLINAALMAKIHTVDWTPAILPNTTLNAAMRANWNGVLAFGKNDRNIFGTVISKLSKHPVLSGIMGGKTNNHGTPYHLTEEFTSVYRMHSLLPDGLHVYSYRNGGGSQSFYDLMAMRDNKATAMMKQHGFANLAYSFGVAHPGALTLNNIPLSMTHIEVPFSGEFLSPGKSKGIIDIGAMDVFRDRERGVPRYNEFRRQIGLKPLRSIEELTSDITHQEKLKKVYNNNIELVDLLSGTLAEGYRPVNFGFGETAFQVFIAMASRRLFADRFFTTDYNAKTYTKEGLDWVNDNNFKTVLLRNYPQLKEALFGVRNAFNPWNQK